MQTYTKDELDAIRATIKAFVEGPEEDLLNSKVDDTNEKEADDDEMTCGCKVVAIMIRDALSEKEHSSRMIDGYYECPPHLFYTDENGKAIRRIFGVLEYADTTLGAHAVSAMPGYKFNNRVIGGVPLKKLIPVKQWSPAQLQLLTNGAVVQPEQFLKRMGFMLCLPKE